MNFREMTKEQLAEESLIDLAYAILEERKSAIGFNDLVKAIQNLNGYSDEEIKARLVQFYTDMNVDGRFLLNHESGWGLREWYKVETIEEETAPTVKVRKKKSKALLDDEEILELDEDDIVFDEDFDEFVEEDEEDEEIDEEDSLDFVEEDIEDIDAEIDEELIPEEEEDFIIEDDEEEEETEEYDEFIDEEK